MTELGFLPFCELIERYFELEGAEAEIRRRYGTRAAVLVVDFTGMVHRTDHHGVVYALAAARRAWRRMEPAIRARGGEVVKNVADTFFAVFREPRAALEAVLDGQRLLAAEGAADPIRAGAGLGYGDLVFVPGEDVFGAEVNRAFVLGEDVATGGEVLATAAFLDAVGGLPDGVGAHRGPADQEEEAGFAFHLLRDYRD